MSSFRSARTIRTILFTLATLLFISALLASEQSKASLSPTKQKPTEETLPYREHLTISIAFWDIGTAFERNDPILQSSCARTGWTRWNGS